MENPLKIPEMRGKIKFKNYVEWDICQFSKVVEGKLRICSPSIHFLNTSWKLEVTFDSFLHYNNFNIILLTEELGGYSTVNYTLGIKDSNPPIKYGPQPVTFGHRDKWTHTSFYYTGKFPHELQKYIHEDTLTIYLEVTSNDSFASTVKDAGSQCSTLYNSTTLCHDLQNLLLSGKDSDVTIKVQEKKFKAHKVILKARTPVFSVMFEHEMREKSNGVVRIDDCDPDTFSKFLRCVYTGTLEDMLPDNTRDMYRIAEKFNFNDLKNICADLIKEELSQETACDIFLFADMHNDLTLRKSAEEYLVKNMKTVIISNKWVSFMSENIVIAAQILKKAYMQANSSDEL